MNENSIVHIVGTRPNFIKLSVVYSALRNTCDQLIVHTGQHYDYELSRVFFKELNIPEPDYNLNVGSDSHGYQIGEMLKRVEKVILKEKPKPCVTLRESTEWVETVETGWNVLVDVDEEKILNALKGFKPRGKPDLSLLGDGEASRRIASILSEKLDR